MVRLYSQKISKFKKEVNLRGFPMKSRPYRDREMLMPFMMKSAIWHNPKLPTEAQVIDFVVIASDRMERGNLIAKTGTFPN